MNTFDLEETTRVDFVGVKGRLDEVQFVLQILFSLMIAVLFLFERSSVLSVLIVEFALMIEHLLME